MARFSSCRTAYESEPFHVASTTASAFHAPLTAIASAFCCPTSTTTQLPRVTLVETRLRCNIR
jgi:hypothetical protein